MPGLIEEVPKIPDGLMEAAKLGQLIPFVGAGVSCLAGCPTWNELANAALHWLIPNGGFSYDRLKQIEHLPPRVKLSMARLLEAEAGISIDFKSLLYPDGKINQPAGIRVYSALFKLSSIFVTTNYDLWLDRRISSSSILDPQNSSPNTISGPMRVVHKPQDFLPSLLSEHGTVIHLHGSLESPDGMVLSTRQYVTHYANDRDFAEPQDENRILTFLRSLFETRTVLFVGYGLEDLEILEYVVQKGGLKGAKSQERHYMLQGYFSHEEALMRSLRNYYMDQCGIYLIPFLRDRNDYGQLTEVLEKFANDMESSERLVLQQVQDMESLLK